MINSPILPQFGDFPEVLPIMHDAQLFQMLRKTEYSIPFFLRTVCIITHTELKIRNRSFSGSELLQAHNIFISRYYRSLAKKLNFNITNDGNIMTDVELENELTYPTITHFNRALEQAKGIKKRHSDTFHFPNIHLKAPIIYWLESKPIDDAFETILRQLDDLRSEEEIRQLWMVEQNAMQNAISENWNRSGQNPYSLMVPKNLQGHNNYSPYAYENTPIFPLGSAFTGKNKQIVDNE